MNSTSSEKDYLKEVQDKLKKMTYNELNQDTPRVLEVEAMTASLVNVMKYIKLNREYNEKYQDE